MTSPINKSSQQNTKITQPQTKTDISEYKKLIGQSVVNSVFEKYDSVENGGNNNRVFDADEVERIIQDQLSKKEEPTDTDADNRVEETDPPVDEETTVNNETKENEEKVVEQHNKQETDEALRQEKMTKYVVQSGETISKIADKFKLSGKEREKFISHLKKQMGDRKWFQAGEEISLSGDYDDAVQEMRNSGNYAETETDIQEQYQQVIRTKREKQSSEYTDDAQPSQHSERVISEDDADKTVVKSTTADAPSKSTKVSKTSASTPKEKTKAKKSDIPQTVLDKYNSIKKAGAGDKVRLVKNDDGSFSIVETDNKIGYMKKNNLKSIEFNYDKNGKFINQYNTVKDGSVIRGTYNSKTKQMEYKLYKDKRGILQIVPDVVNKRAAEIRAQGGKVEIIKGKSTFTLKQTSGKYLKTNNMKSIEIKYTPEGKLVEQLTTRTSGEIQRTTFKNNKKVSTKVAKKASDYPAPVLEHFNKIKKFAKEDVKLKKNNDGTFSVVEFDNNAEYMKKNNLKYIEFVYDRFGKLSYQLNASAKDGTVLKGVPNSKTGKTEYSLYKNAQGILQQIPNKVFNHNVQLQQDGNKSKLLKGKETFTIVQTSGKELETKGLSKIEYKYDPKGKLLQEVYTYKNGRVSLNYDLASNGHDAAHTLNPISIKLPEQYQGKDGFIESHIKLLYGLETKGPKDTAQRFASSLENNKAQLMKTLHITNDEYDNMAILAMGIAEAETHFGQAKYVDTSGNDDHYQALPGNRAFFKKVANVSFWSEDERAKHSQGITQIRYAAAIEDPIVKKRFEENGIKSFRDFLSSPEKQAIATMILLNDCRKVAESDTWQKRLRTNNAKVKNAKDKLTTNDITALLWNGAGGVVTRMKKGETIDINSENIEVVQSQKTGIMPTGGPSAGMPVTQEEKITLKGMSYARNVRAYADKFFAEPEKNQSGAKHMTKTKMQAGTLGATSQGNGGQLGEVVFMPRSYSNSWRTASTATQTKNAIAYIDKNTQLSQASKDLLKGYVKDGIIGFGRQGLTMEEASSITENDVKLMKTQVDLINLKKITPNQANTAFEENYLRSREFKFKNSQLPQSSILRLTTSSNPVNEKLDGIEFTVHRAFYAGGKSPHSAIYTSFNSEANSNVFGATQSQGVNPYLSNGNKVDMKYQVSAAHAEHTATQVFDSGGRCKTGITVDIEFSMGIDHKKIRGKGGKALPHAKMMTEFYSNHPEVFVEVKYIDNGDGTSRELNATDVHKLPCGYYGVFIPGKGYEKESGHAFVSDGFGGCFADEHDNGNWAHFGNGKGEHGDLKVYGLSASVVPVKSEKLGRWVNVPLEINPWYLTPEFQELQKQERAKRGLPPLTPKEEFPV